MKITAQLRIGHNPVTWRDTLTWEIQPVITFNNLKDFKNWIGSFCDKHFDGCTHIDVNMTKDDDTDRWFQIYYKNFKDYAK